MIVDLFGAPIVPGLDLAPDIITAGEEAELIRRIDATDLSPFRFQGWLGKRLTTSYGWKYDFDRGVVEQADPIPDWLEPFRVRAARFAGLQPHALIQASLIKYDPGAGIGWHKDRPIYEHVIGISLGNPATMRFRRRLEKGFERANAPLGPRSIYLLCGEVRNGWEHSIAEMDRPRWSVTFRSFGKAACNYGA